MSRLQRFLNEEDIVKKALSIDEPEKGMTVEVEQVRDILDVIEGALVILKDKVKSLPDSDKDNLIKAQYDDLKDKQMKWQEVMDKLEGGEEEEEEPAPAPEEGGETSPEDDEEKLPPEE